MANTVPEQVRKQIDAAQQHFEQQVEASAAPTEPVAEEPVVEPTQSEPAPTPQPQQHEDDFRQKYLSLQGMYNADVPRLQSTAREQAARIQSLEDLLAGMQAAPQPEPEQPRYLSDNELSEYGESVEIMRKAAHEVVAPLYNRLQHMESTLHNLSGTLQQNVIPQVTQVAQQQASTAQDRFWQGLSNAVPNWQQVNNDKDFHAWLLEVDPMAGVARQQMLEAAQQQMKHQNVAAFFTTWMDITGKYKSNTPAAAQPNRTSSELEKQVAPGRSRSAAAPSQANAKSYTSRDIAQFFDEVRKGQYKGREDERARIERDIFAAQRDGRIVAA